MNNFKDKLRDTCQPCVKYTEFDNLPEVIKDSIIKNVELTATVENSRYTVYRDVVFIKGKAVIDGSVYKYEINLGDLEDNVSIDLLIETFDWDYGHVYLSEVA